MSWYAMVGPVTGEMLSFQTRLLLHDDRAELEWMFPGVRTTRVNGTLDAIADRLGRPVMQLRHHPDLAALVWPLTKGQFV